MSISTGTAATKGRLRSAIRSVRAVVHATTPLALKNILGIGRVLDQRGRSVARM